MDSIMQAKPNRASRRMTKKKMRKQMNYMVEAGKMPNRNGASRQVAFGGVGRA